MAAGLPTEGTTGRKAGQLARTDVPTCSADERLEDVAKRVASAGWNACVVINPSGVVFGLLREKELRGDPGQTIAHAMRPGPSTYRPHVPVAEMAAQMVQHNLENAPITTSDGRLVGLLLREDAVAAAHREHPHGE